MAPDRLQRIYATAQACVRVGLCLIVVYLGYVAVNGFSTLLGPDPIQQRTATSHAIDTTPPQPATAALDIENGYWGFAGWAWEMQQTVGPRENLPLTSPADPEKPEFITGDEAKFLDLLMLLKANRTSEGPVSTYQLDLRSAELIVLTVRDDNDVWIDQALLCIPSGRHGQSQVLRLRRSSRMLGSGDRPELIPLPDFVRRSVARMDESGKVQAELLQGCPPINQLRQQLELHGYSLMQTGRFSAFPDAWFASKSSETFVLWEPAAESSGILLVSRLLAHDQKASVQESRQ